MSLWTYIIYFLLWNTKDFKKWLKNAFFLLIVKVSGVQYWFECFIFNNKHKNNTFDYIVVLCSKYRYDDVSSQRFDDTSIDTAGPVLILWHVCNSGPHLIWKHCLKYLTNTNV